jgi:phosphoribosylanthranilate isomerase
MNITKVTITGADDSTDRVALWDLFQEFPFVEWGILFSKSKIGTPRYPSVSWLSDFFKLSVPCAAHFCGWHSREVVEQGNTNLLDTAALNFNRIQINFTFKWSKSWDLIPVLRWAKNNPDTSLIFQVNNSNREAIETIEQAKVSNNIDLLYDNSGGKGKVIEILEPPFPLSFTGYSGGISPENIEEVANMLFVYFDNDTDVWIDMESGVRTDDQLDLKKVRQVLEVCNQFIKPFKGL